MSRSLLARVSILFLALVLVSLPALAAGGRNVPAEREWGMAAVFWHWLGSLVAWTEKAHGTHGSQWPV